MHNSTYYLKQHILSHTPIHTHIYIIMLARVKTVIQNELPEFTLSI